MRLSPLILAFLFAPLAAAQTPSGASPDKQSAKPPSGLIWQTEPFGPGSADRLSSLPPNARLSVTVDGVRRIVTPSELQDLQRQGKKIEPLQGRAGAATGPPCHVDYSKIDAEQRASDEHLRQMKSRDEVVSVLNQIEQEMYYQDRREKLSDKTCGKSSPPVYSSDYKPPPDMQQGACKALGKICKPVKHW